MKKPKYEKFFEPDTLDSQKLSMAVGHRELTEARKKLLAIRVFPKYRTAFNPSDHHVVESSGSI
jgi:hypothetical protein